jgi:hypothetical protein
MRASPSLAASFLLACARAHGGRGERPRGAIDPEAVRKVIRDHAPQVRWCDEQELTAIPVSRGELTIRWHIDAGGSTKNASVQVDRADRFRSIWSVDDIGAASSGGA